MVLFPIYGKKNSITLFFALCAFISTSIGQVPAYIPYQAIARDGAGLAKINTAIQVEFKIYNTLLAVTPAYQEIHSIVTNDFGYFNLRIGAGTVQSGSFSGINWQTGDVSYEVWIDLGGGSTALGGRSGFLSVPYALYAANASPAPTININTPNSIVNTAPGIYSLQIASPTLSINNNNLSISNGNSVVLPGNYAAGNGIVINGTVISNSQPNQTVFVSGNNVSGSYPSYTVNTPSLSINTNTLSISGGNSVNLQFPQTTTITPGTNVSLNGTSPNYTISSVTPTLSSNGNANITGIYPTQTINVTPQTISINGASLYLSGNGGSVSLPPTTTVSQGSNISVIGNAPTYTITAVTPTLVGGGNASISGMYPLQTITVPPQTLSVLGNNLSLSGGGGNVILPATTTVNPGANVFLNGVAPNYTISAVTPTITGTGNASVTGVYPANTINVPPQVLSMTGNTLNLSNGGNSVDISGAAWSTTGNNGINANTNFIGTTNANDLAFRTNNTERVRIMSTGSVAIGTQTPSAFFDVAGGNIKLGTGSDPFSIMYHGTIQKTNISLIISSTNVVSLSIPGALVGDMLILTLNDHTAVVGNLTLCNAWVSAPGVISFNLSSSAILANVTATFSYIILRP